MIIPASDFTFDRYLAGDYGDHCIIHGDCRDVLPKIPDKAIDLVLTDPPYGIGISSNPFRQKFDRQDWDSNVPQNECFDEMFRSSKEQIIWGGNYFNLPPSQGFFVWDKRQPRTFSSAMCEYAWSSIKSPAKLYSEWVVKIEKFHPTTKPLGLIEFCLSFVTEAQTILDPFLGSGTTLVAAKNLGRRAIGVEISREYCEIAERRLQQEVLNLTFSENKPSAQIGGGLSLGLDEQQRDNQRKVLSDCSGSGIDGE